MKSGRSGPCGQNHEFDAQIAAPNFLGMGRPGMNCGCYTLENYCSVRQYPEQVFSRVQIFEAMRENRKNTAIGSKKGGKKNNISNL